MVYGNVSGKNVNCGDPAAEVVAERADPPGHVVAGCQTTPLQHSDVSAAENISWSWEKLLSAGSTLAAVAPLPSLLLQWSHTDQCPGGSWVQLSAEMNPEQLPSLGTGTGSDKPRQLGTGALACQKLLLGIALSLETNAELLWQAGSGLGP